MTKKKQLGKQLSIPWPEALAAVRPEGSSLMIGDTYYLCNYADEALLMPQILPMTFSGLGVRPGKRGQYVFRLLGCFHRDDVCLLGESELTSVYPFDEAVAQIAECRDRRRIKGL